MKLRTLVCRRRNRSQASIIGLSALVALYSAPGADMEQPNDTSQPGPPFIVNTVADHNDGVCGMLDCTFAEALARTSFPHPNNTINFASNVTGTIRVTAALPTIVYSVVITGPGANVLTVHRDSSTEFRILRVGNGTSPTVSISGLTLSNGKAPPDSSTPSRGGGGILNDRSTLTLRDVAIIGSNATKGGAIHSLSVGTPSAQLTISNCTFAGNTATTGGALHNEDNRGIGATARIVNTTLSGNAAQQGGAIYNAAFSGSAARIELVNCTLNDNASAAGGVYNTRSFSSADVVTANTIFKAAAGSSNFVNVGQTGQSPGTITSQGHNISNDAAGGDPTTSPGGFLNGTGDIRNTDPNLAGLGNNGGPTATHALNSGSVAINAGNDSRAPARDQRYYSRAGTSDIGAFEVNGVPPAPVSLVSAVSRKTHGAAGEFDIALPLINEPGVECRSSSGAHTLVVTFNNSVVSGNASVTTGTGSVSGSPSFTANTMTVNLSSVADVQRITVTLSGVTDSFGQVLPDTPVSVNMLIGDINASKVVNASDIGAVKAQSGLAVTPANFRADVAVSGAINSSDIGLVKSRSGQSVP